MHRRTGSDLAERAKAINAEVRGWIGFYGRFYRSESNRLLRRISKYLVRWARWKCKRRAATPERHAASWPPSIDESPAACSVRVGPLAGYIEYPSHYENGLDSPVGLVFRAEPIDEEQLRGRWFMMLPENMHQEQKEFLLGHAPVMLASTN